MADKEKKQFIDEEGGKTLLLGVLELLEQLQGSITAIGDNSVYLIPIDEVYFSHALGDEENRDPSIEIKAYVESMPEVSSTDDNARVILVPNEEEAEFLFYKELKIWQSNNNPENGRESWIGAYLLVDVMEGDPEGEDWKLTTTIVKHWKDEMKFKPGGDWDHQYYNARFYKTSGGDIWLGSAADLFLLGGISSPSSSEESGSTNVNIDIATTTKAGIVKSTKTGTTSARDYYVEVGTDGTMKVNVPWVNTTYDTASSSLGLVKSTTTGTTAGKDYYVQVLSDGSMKVNVPWSNTTYGLAGANNSGLMDASSYTKLSGMLSQWVGTQAQYDSLSTKNSNTLYIITD